MVLGVVLVGMRLGGLGGDPPSWLPTDHMYDEGWWADAARGEHHFGDPFADDFGTSHLLTPLHTALLRGSFATFGVSLFSLRFVSALCGAGMVLWLVLWLARREGLAVAAAAGVLGLASPMGWGYGRLAVLESEQGLLIFAAFACWFGGIRGRGVWAGLLMAAAAAIKPNSITLGMIPFLATVVGCWWSGAGRADRADRGDRDRPRVPDVLGFGVAFGIGVAGLLAWVYFPHAEAYEALLVSESGSGKVGLWTRIAHMGQAFTSRWTDHHYLWWLLKGSPALTVATWLFCLQFTLSWSGRRQDLRRVLPGLGAVGLFWLILVMGVIGSEFYQPKRRLLFLYAPMLLLSALYVGRAVSSRRSLAWPEHRNLLSRFLFWLVLLWPLLVLAKPKATTWLAQALPPIPLDGVLAPEAGGGYVAGWLLILAWGGVAAVLSGFARRGDRFAAGLVGRVGVAMVALLLLVEGGLLARSYAQFGSTLDTIHRELPELVAPGETVLGNAAATVFLPVPVRTVRRQLPGDFSSPPPNPDVFDRLRPRYLLEEHISNYMDARPHYADCAEDFELLRVLKIGPFRGEVPKHAFRLLVRKGPGKPLRKDAK